MMGRVNEGGRAAWLLWHLLVVWFVRIARFPPTHKHIKGHLSFTFSFSLSLFFHSPIGSSPPTLSVTHPSPPSARFPSVAFRPFSSSHPPYPHHPPPSLPLRTRHILTLNNPSPSKLAPQPHSEPHPPRDANSTTGHDGASLVRSR